MASKSLSKPKIAVYAHIVEESTAALRSNLNEDIFLLKVFPTHDGLVQNVEAHLDEVDCLVLEANSRLAQLLGNLRSRSILLPTVLLQRQSSEASSSGFSPSEYHTAVSCLKSSQIDQLSTSIDAAISQFLDIPIDSQQVDGQDDASVIDQNGDGQERERLAGQQQRLAEKLKERLGYLGIYYKRDPTCFLRRMSDSEKDQLLAELKQTYRDIVLNYFTDDPLLNQKIDNYINSAFFADVPVVQVVEIHMDLMDSISKQLKLEGRSDEILLDYRLTLIDTLANLCEMYRRSIPR